MAIGRIFSIKGYGKRQGGGQSAVQRDLEEFGVTRAATLAIRTEDDRPPIGCPADGRVGRGVIGQALWYAACSWNDKDIGVAVIFSGEGDHGAVGREDRIGFNARAGGEARGVTALPAYCPEIARVGEGDELAVEGRALQQWVRWLRKKQEWANRNEKQHKVRAGEAHVVSPQQILTTLNLVHIN